MKRIFLIVAFVFAVSLTFAQGLEIPAAVKLAFANHYPTVKKVKWDKEQSGYEAGFKLNNTLQSVLFDITGKVLETETEITVNALPFAAQNYLAKTFKNAKIKEAAKITDMKGKMTYEAEINGKDILFDVNGTVIP